MSDSTNKEYQLIWDKILFEGWIKEMNMGWCIKLFGFRIKKHGNMDFDELVKLFTDSNIKRALVRSRKGGNLSLPAYRQSVRSIIARHSPDASKLIFDSCLNMSEVFFINTLRKFRWRRLYKEPKLVSSIRVKKYNSKRQTKHLRMRELSHGSSWGVVK